MLVFCNLHRDRVVCARSGPPPQGLVKVNKVLTPKSVVHLLVRSCSLLSRKVVEDIVSVQPQYGGRVTGLHGPDNGARNPERGETGHRPNGSRHTSG